MLKKLREFSIKAQIFKIIDCKQKTKLGLEPLILMFFGDDFDLSDALFTLLSAPE